MDGIDRYSASTTEPSLATVTFDNVKSPIDSARIRTILYALCNLYPKKRYEEHGVIPYEDGMKYTFYVTWKERFAVKYHELQVIQMIDIYRIKDLRVDADNNQTSIAMEVTAADAQLEITITDLTIAQVVQTVGASKVKYLEQEDPTETKKRKKGAG
jgi:hypothetical protein